MAGIDGEFLLRLGGIGTVISWEDIFYIHLVLTPKGAAFTMLCNEG